MSICKCPRIDGYVLRRVGCDHHAPKPAVLPLPEVIRDPEADEAACAWADYRKDYGVANQHITAAHKAFMAGWQAARQGDQSGALR